VMAQQSPFVRGLEMSNDEAVALGGWPGATAGARGGTSSTRCEPGRAGCWDATAAHSRYDFVTYAQNFNGEA
jgi:hypothetical protein